MGAINTDSLEIDDSSCIRCFECTRVCSSKFLVSRLFLHLSLTLGGRYWRKDEENL